MLARDDGKSAFSFASRAKGDCYDHSVKDEDYSWRAPDVAGLDNSDVLFDEHVRKQRAKVAEQRRGLSTPEQSLGGFSSAPSKSSLVSLDSAADHLVDLASKLAEAPETVVAEVSGAASRSSSLSTASSARVRRAPLGGVVAAGRA